MNNGLSFGAPANQTGAMPRAMRPQTVQAKVKWQGYDESGQYRVKFDDIVLPRPGTDLANFGNTMS